MYPPCPIGHHTDIVSVNNSDRKKQMALEFLMDSAAVCSFDKNAKVIHDKKNLLHLIFDNFPFLAWQLLDSNFNSLNHCERSLVQILCRYNRKKSKYWICFRRDWKLQPLDQEWINAMWYKKLGEITLETTPLWKFSHLILGAEKMVIIDNFSSFCRNVVESMDQEWIKAIDFVQKISHKLFQKQHPFHSF